MLGTTPSHPGVGVYFLAWMRLQEIGLEQQAIAAAWGQSSRLEERTCRPVIHGRRIPPNLTVTRWLFLLDDRPEPIGFFHYFDVNPRNQSAEFGYRVNPRYHHQGIGTEMLRLAISHLFASTDLNKVYCQSGAFNLPSIRLLEKLGFHRDGMLREHHELDGVLWDDYLYSLLRREWNPINSGER